MNRGQFRPGNPGGPGRPAKYPWRALAVGYGFGIPRRSAGYYMKDASYLGTLAKRAGIRVSVRTLAAGIEVVRVA